MSSGGESDGDRPHDPWENAPAPALVGRRLLEGVFGVEIGASRIGLLTHAMHWGYGIANGGLYGLLQASVRTPPLALGPLFAGDARERRRLPRDLRRRPRRGLDGRVSEPSTSTP